MSPMLQPFQGLPCTLIALLIQGVKFVRIVFKTPHLDRALRSDGQYAALVLESLHQFELGIIYGMALAQQQTQTWEASVNVFRNFDVATRFAVAAVACEHHHVEIVPRVDGALHWYGVGMPPSSMGWWLIHTMGQI